MFSPAPSHSAADSPVPSPRSPRLSNRKNCHDTEEEVLEESFYHSFHNNGVGVHQAGSEGDSAEFEEKPLLNGSDGDGETVQGTTFDFRESNSGDKQTHDDKMVVGDSEVCCGGTKSQTAEIRHPPPVSHVFDSSEVPLIPMTLYMHRVNGLVLALLVEPHFMSDTASMEEVVRKKRKTHNMDMKYTTTYLYGAFLVWTSLFYIAKHLSLTVAHAFIR